MRKAASIRVAVLKAIRAESIDRSTDVALPLSCHDNSKGVNGRFYIRHGMCHVLDAARGLLRLFAPLNPMT